MLLLRHVGCGSRGFGDEDVVDVEGDAGSEYGDSCRFAEVEVARWVFLLFSTTSGYSRLAASVDSKTDWKGTI